MKRQHDNYLNGKPTVAHEALMALAKAKMDYLKLKGNWEAESPNDEKIGAMAAYITALKGQLKLDPKSAPLLRRERRRETKVTKVRKASSGKTKRTRQTRRTRRGIRRGSKCHPRKIKRRRDKLESTLTIGASTIWRGQSTNLLTLSWVRSTRTTRRRTATRPTLPSLPQRPPPPSALVTQPFWPLWQTLRKNDGSHQSAFGLCC